MPVALHDRIVAPSEASSKERAEASVDSRAAGLLCDQMKRHGGDVVGDRLADEVRLEGIVAACNSPLKGLAAMIRQNLYQPLLAEQRMVSRWAVN